MSTWTRKLTGFFLTDAAQPPSTPGTPGAPGRAAATGPAGVEVRARSLLLPDGVCGCFAVTGYPAEVTPGWLEPLLGYGGVLEVALHIEPVAAAVAADRLRRQISRLESARRLAADRGRLPDPAAEAATEDAHDLAARLARAEGRLFRVGLYLTVHAEDDEALAEETARVRALAASLLLDVQPATFRTMQGWISTLPLGTDLLRLRRSLDTDAAAAFFPFTSASWVMQVSPVQYFRADLASRCRNRAPSGVCMSSHASSTATRRGRRSAG